METRNYNLIVYPKAGSFEGHGEPRTGFLMFFTAFLFLAAFGVGYVARASRKR